MPREIMALSMQVAVRPGQEFGMLLLLMFTVRQWSLQGATSRSTAAAAWRHRSCPA